MKPQSAESEAAEDVPSGKSKITIVVALSVLVGILLTVIAAGAFFHYHSAMALEARVLAAEDDLKEKRVALDEMSTQIMELSKHIRALKEYSIARSGSADERANRR